jgi:hypothetical protein
MLRLVASIVLIVSLCGVITAGDWDTLDAAPRERVRLAPVIFEDIDASGCIRTTFNVIGRESHTPPHEDDTGMLVGYGIDNVCTEERIEFSQEIVSLGPDEFDVHRNGKSARLDTALTLQVDDGAPPGTTHDVVIALRWTGVGPAQKESSAAGTQRSRAADVDGSVVIDGVTIVPGLQQISGDILWTVP